MKMLFQYVMSPCTSNLSGDWVKIPTIFSERPIDYIATGILTHACRTGINVGNSCLG